MGAYLHPADILAADGSRLAQATSPGVGPVLDAEILGLQLAGEDLAAYAYEPAAIVAAAAAQAQIERAIARAESDLHGAVRGRYALPLSPVDETVVGIVRDLAWAYVHLRGIPEDLAKAAAAARDQLKAIARNDTLLSAALLSAADTAAAPGQDLAQSSQTRPTFDRRELSDYVHPRPGRRHGHGDRGY